MFDLDSIGRGGVRISVQCWTPYPDGGVLPSNPDTLKGYPDVGRSSRNALGVGRGAD